MFTGQGTDQLQADNADAYADGTEKTRVLIVIISYSLHMLSMCSIKYYDNQSCVHDNGTNSDVKLSHVTKITKFLIKNSCLQSST